MSSRLRRASPFRFLSMLCLVNAGMACGLLVSCDGHTSREAVFESTAPASPTAPNEQGPAVPEGLSDAVAQMVEEQQSRIAQQPRDGVGYLELGMIYDRNSLPGAAAAAYEVAARLDTRDARALYHLGRMREVLGDIPGAVDALRQCVQRATQGSQGSQGAPVAMAHARLADLRLSLGELDAARLGFAAAREADADHPAGPEGLARVALAQGDAALAAQILQEQLARHPGRGHARFLLGTAYRALGRLDDARVELEASVGSSPAAPDPWLDETAVWLAGYHGVMGRAVALGSAGQAERIVESLRELREQLPDDVAALEKLVAAELQLGRTQEAKAELSGFLGRWPEHPRAWYLMALVVEAQGDLDGAAQAVARSLAIQEDWVPAHELAARLAWRREDLRASAESMHAALHFGGPKHDTMLKLARAYVLLGDPPASRATLREAVLAFPGSTEVWIQLCTEALGSAAEDPGAAAAVEVDLPEARRALARAVELAPGDARVAQLTQALDAISTAAGGSHDG